MQSIDSVLVSKGAAIVAGPRVSFLDHIMPFVDLWKLTLVCTDSWVYTCAQLYYPPADIILASAESFQQLLSDFSVFVTVEPCRLHSGAMNFGQLLYRGQGETLAGFHGNPYKFRNDYWIERYADEDTLFIYGQYLIDYLEEKAVLNKIKKIVHIGNMRNIFYKNHKPFFDQVAQPYLFPTTGRKTILWAPTWSYPHCPDLLPLLEELPDHLQILVKPHPFMYRMFPEKIGLWKEKSRGRENILFIDEIPLIYPFISQADFYLGDYSSVAYDFLSVDRPLFLTGNADVEWATPVKEGRELFKVLEQEDTLSEKRLSTYKYVYEVNWHPAR